MRTITFTFHDDGACEIEAEGFRGQGCRQATRPYEEGLGLEGVTVEEKPEILAAAEGPTVEPQVRAR